MMRHGTVDAAYWNIVGQNKAEKRILMCLCRPSALGLCVWPAAFEVFRSLEHLTQENLSENPVGVHRTFTFSNILIEVSRKNIYLFFSQRKRNWEGRFWEIGEQIWAQY